MSAFVLASASPRRAALLAMAGYRFHVEPSDTSEDVDGALSPSDHVAELACRKARAVAEHHDGRLVLGVDTVVALKDHILEKPTDRNEAVSMLRRLSGASHAVYSGVCLVLGGTERRWQVVERTEVTFRTVSPVEIERYVDTDEPYDKAGAYAAQGRAASFISRIDGCFSNVVGLPLAAFWDLLRTATDDDPWPFYDGADAAPDMLHGTHPDSSAPRR